MDVFQGVFWLLLSCMAIEQTGILGSSGGLLQCFTLHHPLKVRVAAGLYRKNNSSFYSGTREFNLALSLCFLHDTTLENWKPNQKVYAFSSPVDVIVIRTKIE